MSLFKKIKKKPFLLILVAVFERIPFRPIKLVIIRSFLLTKSQQYNQSIKITLAKESDIYNIKVPFYKKEFFLKRICSGEICLLASIDGCVAGYEWFTVSGVHIEERYNIPLEIPDNTLYAYDAYVYPKYRRQGVWKGLIQYSSKILSENNKTAIISYIDYGNVASENAHEKIGFMRGFTYIYIIIFGFKYKLKFKK